jgi:hypothetical protein
VIAGPLDESNNGGQKEDKGSPGDDKPETKKKESYQSLSQETKPILGYAQ